MLTAARVRADVAALLHRSPDEISEGENLCDAGLDSVRLMTLLEGWREAGAEITFVVLAERPTLGEWVPLLTSRTQAVHDA
jgi:bifunctional isochorismate lyase / aryl carrier protein